MTAPWLLDAPTLLAHVRKVQEITGSNVVRASYDALEARIVRGDFNHVEDAA